MPEIFRIDDAAIAELRALPETGMGFQIIETPRIVMHGSDFWLVLDGRFATAADERSGFDSWVRSRSALTWWDFFGLESRRLSLGRASLAAQRVREERWYAPSGLASSAVPTRSALVKSSKTVAGMRVHRFSATKEDLRVDPTTGDFRPGTYATTETDRPFAPSGFAAVGRFALPNVQPASYLYSIEPAADTPVLIGTVGPAYGQAGGGVEVLFPEGAKNAGRFEGPTRIPDE